MSEICFWRSRRLTQEACLPGATTQIGWGTDPGESIAACQGYVSDWSDVTPGASYCDGPSQTPINSPVSLTEKIFIGFTSLHFNSLGGEGGEGGEG